MLNWLLDEGSKEDWCGDKDCGDLLEDAKEALREDDKEW